MTSSSKTQAGLNIFVQKRAVILSHLSKPDELYTDASPKGSVDAGIRSLIDDINNLEHYVTTSSCAGRVAVYFEGSGRTDDGNDDDTAQPNSNVDGAAAVTTDGGGTKGNGGRWLYVSHDPLYIQGEEREGDGANGAETDWACQFGLVHAPGKSQPTSSQRLRLVHFKFEPMILHIITDSIANAQRMLAIAQQAGFRESGASSLTSPCPMVAVRSHGLALDSVIGCLDQQNINHQCEPVATVPESHLRTLVRVANERFKQNEVRVSRFHHLLRQTFSEQQIAGKDAAWEDPRARRERKKAEGLRRREELRLEKEKEPHEETNSISFES